MRSLRTCNTCHRRTIKRANRTSTGPGRWKGKFRVLMQRELRRLKKEGGR